LGTERYENIDIIYTIYIYIYVYINYICFRVFVGHAAMNDPP
jgi:hypothetical protein